LKHEIFAESINSVLEKDYPWTLAREERAKLTEDKQSELADESLNKLYSIYVARSSTLFSPDNVLMWLKEVIGYLLNRLDEGALERELVIAKFTSLTPMPFCALSRYRHLRASDFTDDITTINANELLMGAAGGPEQQIIGGAGAADNNQVAAQQIQQMID
jgi:hypothetical protein